VMGRLIPTDLPRISAPGIMREPTRAMARPAGRGNTAAGAGGRYPRLLCGRTVL
jgi:hypothetical protein